MNSVSKCKWSMRVLVLQVFWCKFPTECIRICVLPSWQKETQEQFTYLFYFEKLVFLHFLCVPDSATTLLVSYSRRNVCHHCIEIKDCPASLLLGVTKDWLGRVVLPKGWLGTVIPPALELRIQGTSSFAHVAKGGAVALLWAGGAAVSYLCFSSQNAVKLLWM